MSALSLLALDKAEGGGWLEPRKEGEREREKTGREEKTARPGYAEVKELP